MKKGRKICPVRKLRSILIMMVFTMLYACADSNEDLDRYIHRMKMRSPEPIESIPEIAEPEKFQYPEKVQRRNPFKPVVKQTARQDTLAPDQNRPKMPLENFPLDALKFVGTLSDGTMKWGLVAEPGGKIIRVKPGDYMGENYGKILSISDEALLLQETLKVGGQWKKKKTTFKIKSEN